MRTLSVRIRRQGPTRDRLDRNECPVPAAQRHVDAGRQAGTDACVGRHVSEEPGSLCQARQVGGDAIGSFTGSRRHDDGPARCEQTDLAAARPDAEVVAYGYQVRRGRVDQTDVELAGVAESHTALAPDGRGGRELRAENAYGAGVRASYRWGSPLGDSHHERAQLRPEARDWTDRRAPRPEDANHLRLVPLVAEHDGTSYLTLDGSVGHQRVISIGVVHDEPQRSARPTSHVGVAPRARGGDQRQARQEVDPRAQRRYGLDRQLPVADEPGPVVGKHQDDAERIDVVVSPIGRTFDARGRRPLEGRMRPCHVDQLGLASGHVEASHVDRHVCRARGPLPRRGRSRDQLDATWRQALEPRRGGRGASPCPRSSLPDEDPRVLSAGHDLQRRPHQSVV